MSDYTMRHYEPKDYEMLCAWWYAHGKAVVPESVLSKCGVVCERGGDPIAALFLHMDNSCGMCMADHAVSTPNLPLSIARKAFAHCMECLKKIAADLGYHTVAVFVYPGIAKILQKQGFIRAESGLVQMFAPTKDT